MKKISKSFRAICLTEISILLISVLAFGFLIGSEIKLVSGVDPKPIASNPFDPPTTLEPPVAEIPTNKAPPVGGLKTPPVKTGTTVGDWLANGNNAWSKGWANGVGGIASGIGWAATVVGIVQLVGGLLGLEKGLTNALTYSLGAGVLVGRAVNVWSTNGGFMSNTNLGMGTWGPKASPVGWGIGVGLVVAAIVFYLMYETEETYSVTYTCEPWDAPTGGKDCEKCNKLDLGCSEYMCKSLGQTCELVNAETEKEKLCVAVNNNDVAFPIIEPWTDALLANYKYNPDNRISPPDRGVYVVNINTTDGKGCAEAFTPITFGIKTNEPSKCKIDFLRKNTFENMSYWFGGSSTFKYNHTQVMSLPGPSAVKNESPIVNNNGQYEMNVRCMDAKGNKNTATFVFKFCVDAGPDTTAPVIVETSLLNGMPIQYNKSSVNLDVYVNEPSTCKWSRRDQDYKDMENTMTCASKIANINARMLYKCSTTLTGIKNEEENNFYFRCKDKPTASESDRNVNSQSFNFKVTGTKPLVITEVTPNSTTIKDATENVKVTLKVKTSAGYKEGEANCYFSQTGNDEDYILFANTNSYLSTQELYLTEGSYTYFVKCVDLGGNADVESVKFLVDSDSEAPLVVRLYKEETYLKAVTNENASCVYDLVDCNYLFIDGKPMNDRQNIEHYTDWSTQSNFYIKCRDSYNNEPLPNECSIVARPLELISSN